jgi:hypothetical protein
LIKFLAKAGAHLFGGEHFCSGRTIPPRRILSIVVDQRQDLEIGGICLDPLGGKRLLFRFVVQQSLPRIAKMQPFNRALRFGEKLLSSQFTR